MIIRIVHLQFKPEAIGTFEDLFKQAAPVIKAWEGCRHLELWQNIDDHAAFTTCSFWEDAEALEAYRKSDFFRKTWAATKVLFAAPPRALSFKKWEDA